MFSRISPASMCDAAEDKAQQKERMEQELEATRAALKAKYTQYYGVPNGPSAPAVRAELKAESDQMEADIVKLEAALLELQGGGGKLRTHAGAHLAPIIPAAKLSHLFDSCVRSKPRRRSVEVLCRGPHAPEGGRQERSDERRGGRRFVHRKGQQVL